MKIGIASFVCDLGLTPTVLATAVEERGFESLFVTEHTHFPCDPGPAPWGGEPGPEYGRTLDPFVTLALAAQAAPSLTVGTAVCLVAQHDPIALAKTIATVDHLAPGRLVVGVGFGWCRPELDDHGVAFAERDEVVAERVALMRALWSASPEGFTGRWHRMHPSVAHPAPGAGRPPVLLGAPPSPRTTRHLTRWADGWIPSDRPTLIDDLTRVRAALDDAGRDPDRFTVTVVGPQASRERLAALASAGVERALFWIPPWPGSEAVRRLDELATLVGDG